LGSAVDKYIVLHSVEKQGVPVERQPHADVVVHVAGICITATGERL